MAGALGNAADNKLPVCQIAAIQEILSQLPHSQDLPLDRKWFWIDTLCVPLAYLHRPDTRKAVARSIESISRCAKWTVVIDADHSLLSSTSDFKELFIRMAYSSWSSRLWTFQEAVYARHLIFHLSDQNIELNALMEKYGSRAADWESAWCFRLPYRQWRQYLNSETRLGLSKSDEHLQFLCEALEGRVTSNEADEPLILASLLGVDPDDAESGLEVFRSMKCRADSETRITRAPNTVTSACRSLKLPI